MIVLNRCNNLNITTVPYDDNKAIYDMDEHRYIVTVEYFLKRTGIDLEHELQNKNHARVFLDKISARLYNLIYSTANIMEAKKSKRVKEYLLAKDHDMRDIIIKAMISYGEASITERVDTLGNSPKTDTIRNFMPDETSHILEPSGIMWRGTYTYCVADADYRSDY